MDADRIGQFKKALALDPESEIALFGLAGVYFRSGAFVECEETLRSLLRIKPDYSAAYLLLGKALEKLVRTGEAEAVYREGLRVTERTRDMMPRHEMEHRLMKLEFKEKMARGG